ncbi:hypothetical protein IAR55_002876 [Kwoniella newhampshirensis]|uniref:BZIP domain-containing protein n=1 Tax=Kwoniella newhampshirensis TaxID=1651941 RepID=A0AAW0Z060_9TREE
MSVAIPSPAPTPLATRRPSTMMPKPASTTRIQSRPSTSTPIHSRPSSSSTAPANIQSRPMAPRPAAASSSRPTPTSTGPSTPSSGTGKVALPRSATTTNATGNTGAGTRPPPASRTSSSTSAAVTPVASKDTSSSAGKIFAKPSKEWVLPERAKPGRKVSVEEPDNKRQSQNRLSQRAHRARRTDYIQTLEERLRQYEADEIHSNVRLQEVARALKADNERLKAEVTQLQNKCMEHNGERDVWELEKRTMKDAIREMRMEVEVVRAGGGIDTLVRLEVDQGTIDSLVPGPSIPRRQSTVVTTSTHRNPIALQACPICPDPDPDCPCQQSQPQQPGYAQEITLASFSHSHDHHHKHGHGVSTCGLCHSAEECLCRVVEEDIKPNVSSPSKSFKSDEGCGLCTGGGFCACRAGLSESPSISSSNKPLPVTGVSTTVAETSGVVRAVVAALPLRLRSKASGISKTPIWAIHTTSGPAAAIRSSEAVCTGDPSNCDACRNDTFGREFCQHLFEAADSSAEFKPCSSCPGNCMNIKTLLSPSPDHPTHASSSTTASTSSSSAHIRTPPTNNLEDDMPLGPLQMSCCGNPELCGGQHGGGGCTGEVVGIGGSSGLPPSSSSDRRLQHDEDDDDGDHGTLRPDQAWKQLKAHPNAKFASLALLADVVARRTKCLGPRVEMSPAPPSPMPSPVVPMAIPARSSAALEPASATMTSQARKRQFEIETSGLRDALKLLDKATPTPSSPMEGERQLKRRRVDG